MTWLTTGLLLSQSSSTSAYAKTLKGKQTTCHVLLLQELLYNATGSQALTNSNAFCLSAYSALVSKQEFLCWTCRDTLPVVLLWNFKWLYQYSSYSQWNCEKVSPKIPKMRGVPCCTSTREFKFTLQTIVVAHFVARDIGWYVSRASAEYKLLGQAVSNSELLYYNSLFCNKLVCSILLCTAAKRIHRFSG